MVQPKTKEVIAQELYDHQNDPQETVNIANDEKYKCITQEHHEVIAGGWEQVANDL